MRITEASIVQYHPLTNCTPHIDEGLTVISGPNEAGKTLYLEGIMRLLDPDVVAHMDPEPRVESPPTGSVTIELNGEYYDLDGSTSVTEFTPIESPHLPTIFTVRDNDLELPTEQGYYTSLIEKLGEIHTSEIERIKETLREYGRLTKKRLNISSQYDDAGNVVDDARSLAADIRSYVEKIEAENLDTLIERRIRTRRELADTRDALRIQEQARTLNEYERLSTQLQRYRRAGDALETLDDYDEAELEELRELKRSMETAQTELEQSTATIEALEEDLDASDHQLDERRARMSKLERREEAVAAADTALATYRDKADQAAGSKRRLTLGKWVTIGGLLGGGIAGGAGAVSGQLAAIGLGVLLLVIGLLGALIYWWSDRQLTATTTAAEAAIRQARDAGLAVEGIEEISPAIEDFEQDLQQIRQEVNQLSARQEAKQDRLNTLESQVEDLDTEIHEAKRMITERLEAVGVESIAAYASKVDERETHQQNKRVARQSLVDRFGDPSEDGYEAKAEGWKRELAAMIDDIDDEAIDAADYREERYQELTELVDDLATNLEEVTAQLQDHDEQLDAFDRRVRGLNTQPFIGDTLALDMRTKAGLEALADELERLVEGIEDDAERSRKALRVFERIEVEEEQKLTELFDPEGPASRTFHRLTDGYYTEVAYDADDHTLAVYRNDGRVFTPELLSQGTKDQLYFASRVSLAQQILGSEPGFFLLDDPFMAADPDRLRNGFETLLDLVDAGWQVIYLTAKGEVAEGMVDEFGLAHEQLNELAPTGW